MKRLVAAFTSAVALLGISGPAALALAAPGAVGSIPESGHDGSSFLDQILRPLGLRPGSGLMPTAASGGGSDPFASLRGDAYAAYGTGTAYTSDAELSGVKVGIEKAFSSAVYGSAALAPMVDETERAVAPGLAAGHGFGWGSAAEIGRGSDEDRVELNDDAQAQAPPSGDVASREVQDVKLIPLLHADVLQSKASARSATNGCVIGSDLAFGQGSAVRSDIPGEEGDAERPIISLSADDEPRAVTHSLSRTGLIPPGRPDTARFGVFSEVRQTVAPVTLFRGQENETTVELGGEWILRVATDGVRGIWSYGPVVDDPQTVVVRVDRKHGLDVELTAQQVFEADGTDLSTPGVDEFVIGEAPRAIGGGRLSKPLVSATRVSAAVDVYRVRIPDETEPDGVVEVRVGHMEAAVAVPAGGVVCPGIAMAKTSDPAVVEAGDVFDWTIKVANPNDCLLEQVRITDVIAASEGLEYRIVDTSPKAAVNGSTLVFPALKPLRMGESFTARIRVAVEPDSRPGRFTNEARAAGACGSARVGGEGRGDTGIGQAVPRDGSVTLHGPDVRSAAAAASPLPAPGPAVLEASSDGGEVTSARTIRRAGGGAAAPPAASRATRPGTTASPGSTARSGALARTGGWYGFLVGTSLLVCGRVFRLAKRRR